jgi:protein TonB
MKVLILFIGLLAFSIRLSAQTTDTSNVASKDTITSIEHLDSPPGFPGGVQKFNEYIKKNFKFSKFDLDNHIVGGINFIRFVVEKDGSLTHIEPLRSSTPDTEKESIRLIKESPKWIPAMSGGKPCRVRFTVPIRYQVPE